MGAVGNKARSGALSFFGASGDLAYKKIFPALQAMAKRGVLDFPVIGVARSGWNLDQLIERARASCNAYGGVDETAFAVLAKQLRYVDGDYNEPSTFEKLKKELQETKDKITVLDADLKSKEITNYDTLKLLQTEKNGSPLARVC